MTSASKRLPQLDLLRAAAVFLVIGNHMTICPSTTNRYFYHLTEFWNRGGWIGVDLFFVLSGFLVSGLLFTEYKKNQNLNLKRFLIRRGFKIYPAFWVFLAFTFLLAAFHELKFFSGLDFLSEFLFLQNYVPNLWEHTWTLAVEEHFYIGLCVLFYILIRFKRSAVANPFANIGKIFAVLAIGCFILRLATVTFLPFDYTRDVEPTHLRIDSLFFGVFLSYLWHFRNLSENKFIERNKISLGIAGALAFLPAFLFDFNSHNAWIAVGGLTLFYLGAGALLLAALKSDVSKIPLANFAAYLGAYSYSIYLWNIPVQNWLVKSVLNLNGNENWFFYFAVYLVATLAIGVAMSKLVEYPFLRIRDRYFPSKNAPLIKIAET